MAAAPDTAAGGALAHCDPFQAQFHGRWGRLRNRHARTLAYLISGADLLDLHHPLWENRIVSGQSLLPDDDGARAWLEAIDADDAPLVAAMGNRAYTRLGLYAEKLLAACYDARGMLEAHSLQVQADRTDTVGEFDFLLRTAAGLLHVELATKFYLLAPDRADFGGFVGPNLGDRFGGKMEKILRGQLMLGRHPAALAALPQPLAGAAALVRGWLFYPDDHLAAPLVPGAAPDHQRGFWRAADEFDSGGLHAVVLPKMQWLAPAALAHDAPQVLAPGEVRPHLQAYFARQHAPVLVALLVRSEEGWLEARRGFAVPADWPARATAFAA